MGGGASQARLDALDFEDAARGTEHDPGAASLSVVVPTRNERLNVAPLFAQAAEALSTIGVPWEIVFVDDSDDSTPEAVRELRDAGEPVQLVHREPGQRDGGLAGAVLTGFATAHGSVLAVMDGDLQHPPEALPHLAEPALVGEADIVVATRYVEGASRDGLNGAWRRAVSSGARRLVRLIVPRSRAVSDPLGGFFVVRRSVVEGVELQPDGFKILLEVLAHGRWDRAAEVPYSFGAREQGESKASVREGLRFGRHVVRLVRTGRRAASPVHLAGSEPAKSFGQEAVGRLRAVAGRCASRLGQGLSSMSFRIALAGALVIAAYWYPLRSLMSAWLPWDAGTAACLVPVLAGAALASALARNVDEAPIHDREVDYLIGLAALGAALFMLIVLPRRMAVAFWIDRLDLLSLPLFVAGAIAVLFGTRALWRARYVLVFLLLAWPPVLRGVAERISRPLGEATLNTLRALAPVLGLAHASPGSGKFSIVGGGSLVIGPAAGTAAVVLLALTACLALALVTARKMSMKLAWLVLVVLFALLGNFVRLVVALTVARLFGASAGRTVLDTAGLLSATAIVILLAIGMLRQTGPRSLPTTRIPISLRAPGMSARLAFAPVALVALGSALVSGGYTRFAPLAGPLGNAKLSAFTASSPPPPGFEHAVVDDGGSPSPGRGSRHLEFRAIVPLRGRVPRIVVDVLPVSDPGESVVSDLRSRYSLGRFDRAAVNAVRLGHGTRGDVVTFRSADGEKWTALSWAWPVHGDPTSHYERLVVAGAEPLTATARVTLPASRAGSRPTATLEEVLAFERGILEASFAKPSGVELAVGRTHGVPARGRP